MTTFCEKYISNLWPPVLETKELPHDKEDTGNKKDSHIGISRSSLNFSSIQRHFQCYPYFTYFYAKF